MYQTGKSSWLKHWDFILLDILVMQLAYVIAFVIRHGCVLPYSWRDYRIVGIIIVLVQLCISLFSRNYEGILRRGYIQEFRKTVVMVTTVILAILVYLFLVKTTRIYSRSVIIQMWFWASLFIYLERLIWKKHICRIMLDKKHLQKLVVVVSLAEAKEVLDSLEANKYKDFYIEGIILLDGKEEKEIGEIPVVAVGKGAVSYLEENPVDQIFIVGNRKDSVVEEIFELSRMMGTTIHYGIGEQPGLTGDTIIENFCGQLVLTSSVKFADARQMVIKRLMDVLGGGIGVILTAILAVFLAPVIYVQSPGPIFFSQERVGRNGRRFRIYKFRSMYPDAEQRKKELMEKNKMQGLMFKMDDDPRIIPIGRFIRKTSLDEFPQFFNVLRGDMSLVGTRPPTVDEYEQYEAHHKIRLAIKPGLTGMWQVSGRSDVVDFEEVVKLDKKYIENWSLGLDIKILCKTVKVVITGKGSV